MVMSVNHLAQGTGLIEMLAMATVSFLKVQDVGRITVKTKLNIINGIQRNNSVHFMSKTSPVPSCPVTVLIGPAVNHLHTVAIRLCPVPVWRPSVFTGWQLSPVELSSVACADSPLHPRLRSRPTPNS